MSIHSSVFSKSLHQYYFTSMHLIDFFPSSVVISFFISILFHGFPKYICQIDFRYANCYSSVECGRALRKIQYPLWVNSSQLQLCGHLSFELRCMKDEATLWIGPELFHVIGTRTQTLKITRFYDPSMGNIACPY